MESSSGKSLQKLPVQVPATVLELWLSAPRPVLCFRPTPAICCADQSAALPRMEPRAPPGSGRRPLSPSGCCVVDAAVRSDCGQPSLVQAPADTACTVRPGTSGGRLAGLSDDVVLCSSRVGCRASARLSPQAADRPSPRGRAPATLHRAGRSGSGLSEPVPIHDRKVKPRGL